MVAGMQIKNTAKPKLKRGEPCVTKLRRPVLVMANEDFLMHARLVKRNRKADEKVFGATLWSASYCLKNTHGSSRDEGCRFRIPRLP